MTVSQIDPRRHDLRLSFDQGGCRGFCLCEESQFSHGILSHAIDRSLIQTKAKTQTETQLALIFHVHAVIELDIVAIEEAGRGIKLRTRDPFHQMGYPAAPL